jgi:hypothetical protein
MQKDTCNASITEDFSSPQHLFNTEWYTGSDSDDNAPITVPDAVIQGLGVSLTPQKVLKAKTLPAYMKRKTARNSGKGYCTVKGKVISEKTFSYAHCRCKNQCKNVSVEQRKELFANYWKMQNWQAQSNFITQTVSRDTPKRTYVANSRKKFTRAYSLGDKKVCKPVYLKTLGITHRRVDFCLNRKSKQGMCSPDKRGITTPNKTPIIKINLVNDFLENIPKFVSHYSQSEKSYFPSHLSRKQLYEMYLSKTKPNTVSYPIFCGIFKKFNVPIYRNKSDTCQRCDSLTTKLRTTDLEEEKEEIRAALATHQQRAEQARNELRNSTENAKTNNNFIVFTFDMEKTQPLPALNTSVVFYKRQLWIYNVGINRCHDNQAFMAMWTEDEGKRGSQEVCSSLYAFLGEQALNNHRLKSFSDACGGQNRNKNIILFMQWACNHLSLTEWEHRYLESGHSYLPNDRDFGLIEKKKKRSLIYTKEEWFSLVETAQTKRPFQTIDMRDKFKDLKALSAERKFPVKDNKGKKFNFLKLTWFRIVRGSPTLYYRCSDDETGLIHEMDIPYREQNDVTELENNTEINFISKEKYSDLMALLPYIPPVHHSFYKNLPHH